MDENNTRLNSRFIKVTALNRVRRLFINVDRIEGVYETVRYTLNINNLKTNKSKRVIVTTIAIIGKENEIECKESIEEVMNQIYEVLKNER